MKKQIHKLDPGCLALLPFLIIVLTYELMPLLELIAALERATGRTATIEHRPERPGDVRASRAVNAVLRELFPEIEPVPLAEGLAQATAWMETRMMEAAR